MQLALVQVERKSVWTVLQPTPKDSSVLVEVEHYTSLKKPTTNTSTVKQGA